MPATAQYDLSWTTPDPWDEIATAAAGWARERDLQCRDVILLLPFAQLLPLARRAFCALGGWMPRIETTQSLARALGPGEPSAAGQLSFDVAADGVAARHLLRAQAWAAAWAQDDARGFALAVAELVQSAHAIARAAQAVPPAQRALHWEHARELLAISPVAIGVPGARERALSRVALEWAAAAAAPASDRLFMLQPAAWIALQAGGPDTLTENILQSAANTLPCLRLNSDPDPAAPFDLLAAAPSVRFATCDEFESEAQQSAACVLYHLQRGEQPVAVIAQDRVLVRRVRALLARQRVTVRDETGWKLSTTRAGASIHRLLAATRPDASTDDWLDWLKCCQPVDASCGPALPGLVQALDDLELALRARKLRLARSVDAMQLPPRAAEIWRTALQALRPMATLGAVPVRDWLATLATALGASGQRAVLEADDAGRQVLAALGLASQPSPAGSVLATVALEFDAFREWLDAVLEQASYVPASPESADVVITPLARAMLRPFAAAVFAGTDERQLGVAKPAHGLLSLAHAKALGLPDRQATRDAEVLAFAHVVRLPKLTLLRRTVDDGEPLAASPLLSLLQLALRRTRPEASLVAPEHRVAASVALTPIERPQPRAPALLPQRLSASACEALRSCPYRFFALRLLRLNESEELAAGLEKRDYGTWLHAVLQRFHSERTAPLATEVEAARLHAVARNLLVEQQLDEAEFLPYSATFARLVPRYMEWLHRRDADGATWLDGESDFTAQPPEWGAVQMHGVIDRLDSVDDNGVRTTQLIDYKTGSAQPLRDAIKRGEDTQLAFYAALVAAQSTAAGPLSAMYLMLDESDKVLPLPHDDVQASAAMLVHGIGRDLQRLAAGAAMPALGEGAACDVCKVRGLCRRDHWPAREDGSA